MLSVVLFTLLVVYENVILGMVWRVRHPTMLDVGRRTVAVSFE